MSSPLPSGWGVPTADDGIGPSSGAWDLDATVNPQTSITCVDMPYYSKANPLQGTKAARDSLLKLLTGMNNDTCPLNFRDETEKDHVTADPYFSVAPHWSTLSGGRKPYIHIEPAEAVRMLKRAAACVPLVRRVRVFVVDAQGAKREVSIEELMQMNITVQQVPNLYKRAAAAGAGPNAVAAAPAINIDAIENRQRALEDALSQVQAMLKTIVNSTHAASTAALPPAPAASVDAEEEGDAAAPPKRARRA